MYGYVDGMSLESVKIKNVRPSMDTMRGHCYLLHLQIADAVELMLLSVLSPSVKCQWGLSTAEQALITTVSIMQALLFMLCYTYMGVTSSICTTAVTLYMYMCVIHFTVHVKHKTLGNSCDYNLVPIDKCYSVAIYTHVACLLLHCHGIPVALW